MENVLLFDNTPLESLTPDSIPENDEYLLGNEQPSTPLTPIPTKQVLSDTINNKTEQDAFLILKEESNTLLPSPPPQNDTIYNKRLSSAVIVNNENDKPPVIAEGCKWCQRCGTIDTPRWRYGPGGPLSLCNACHLRWKTLGKPADGYSATTFPPPFYNPIPRTTKRKWGKKNNNTNNKRTKKNNIKVEQQDNKENLSTTTKKVTPKPPTPTPPTKKQQEEKEEKVVVIPGTCISCNTTETPLWRKGPLGSKTLCNACGLRWAKVPFLDTNLSKLKISPTIKKTTNSALLHQKKEYIKHGLYSIENRITEKLPPQLFSFPLPMHQGEFIMSKQVDFELPPDIHQERELSLIKGLMANRQPFFTRIRSNIFVERKPQHKPDEQAVCHCVPPTDADQKGCGDDCINRMLFYECDPKLCPCGIRCSNQRFQRKERTKGLQVFQTDSRGWGLRTLVDIKKGDLVIEYRGEVISHELCEERMCTVYVNEKNFYFLDYCNGEVIDACTKGTEARFINHSCNPNCHIEKWSLKGESHFGVFASKGIQAKSELFYDYNFSTFNGSVESQQRCYCGSELCRGTIGKKGSAPHQKSIAAAPTVRK